jgi:hypothetical protein
MDIAEEVAKQELFKQAASLWSLEKGVNFQSLNNEDNGDNLKALFQLLQFGIHPCSSLRPTAKQLFDTVLQTEE